MENERQQRIEGMFMWAFERAAEVRLHRRLNKALRGMALERQKSPEYARLREWRAMMNLQRQLGQGGVKSRPVLHDGDKRIGIAITYKGITHECFDAAAIDTTLTMIAEEGS